MVLLYLRSHTIQEVGGEMLTGSSIYGIVEHVIDGSLYSRFYGMYLFISIEHAILTEGWRSRRKHKLAARTHRTFDKSRRTKSVNHLY